MSKVTSKFQVSIPRSFADQLRIEAGDDIEWRIAGDELRVSPSKKHAPLSLEKRLELFDAGTKRQSARNRRAAVKSAGSSRGWKREDLYTRGGRSR
jgi:bifunctional DNA-binding transcriptional regulator/antitoxin component of YhaV-PrlF toxin-antitoxin module